MGDVGAGCGADVVGVALFLFGGLVLAFALLLLLAQAEVGVYGPLVHHPADQRVQVLSVWLVERLAYDGVALVVGVLAPFHHLLPDVLGHKILLLDSLDEADRRAVREHLKDLRAFILFELLLYLPELILVYLVAVRFVQVLGDQQLHQIAHRLFGECEARFVVVVELGEELPELALEDQPAVVHLLDVLLLLLLGLLGLQLQFDALVAGLNQILLLFDPQLHLVDGALDQLAGAVRAFRELPLVVLGARQLLSLVFDLLQQLLGGAGDVTVCLAVVFDHALEGLDHLALHAPRKLLLALGLFEQVVAQVLVAEDQRFVLAVLLADFFVQLFRNVFDLAREGLVGLVQLCEQVVEREDVLGAREHLVVEATVVVSTLFQGGVHARCWD